MVSSGSKTSIIHVNLTRQLICHHFRMEIYMHSHKSLNINSVQDDTTVMLSHIQCRVVQWSGFCRVLVQRVMIPCWDHWGMDTYKSGPTGVWLMWLWVVGVTHSCGFRYPQPLPTPMTISQTRPIGGHFGPTSEIFNPAAHFFQGAHIVVYRFDCLYLLYSIHFSQFMPKKFTKKWTKHENTWSPPFLYNTKMAADGCWARKALILRELL